MNVDLKKVIYGVIALLAIFCAAVVFNNILDRSGDDSIIISNESELYSQDSQESENVSETQTFSNQKSETDDFNGYLKYQKSNGDIYDGEWKNGLYDGNGVLTRKTGEIYDGMWIQGALDNGKITFKINNFGGTKTVNIYYNQNWNGNGKNAVIEENGNIYDGEWHSGKKNGNGILYARGENETPTKIRNGVWEDDVLTDGTETTLYDDGVQTYIVQVKGGFRNGKGILYDQNGKVVSEEQWLNDEPIEY